MRIDSQAEAKKALHHHHHHHHKHGSDRLDPDIDTSGVHVDRSITGVGMDGIDVSPEMLRSAYAELGQAQERLRAHLDTAKKLHGPLGDGSGPVAATMRPAFLDRASYDGGGVRAALHNYIAELENVRHAITETLTTYETVDADVAGTLNQQSGEQA